jgi:hypothetical protein
VADRARFDVILTDRVSPGAKGAAGSLSVLQKQLMATNALTRSSSAHLARWGVQIRRDFGAEQRAIRSLNNTSYTLGRASGFSMQAWGTGATQASTATSTLTSHFSGLGSAMMVVGTTAATVAAGFGRIAYEAGGAYLSIARFREDSLTSMSTLLGSQAAAGRSFGNALLMANQTPLDPQDVIGMFTSFSAGGFGERELAPLAAAAADIQAARGQAASDSLVRVLTQIRGLGRVMRGDITMQGISAGLNAGDIFGSIARQMNLGTGAAGIRAAEAAVSHGRVNDRIAIQAFLDSVRRRYDSGGDLGTFAVNTSRTLTGAISNLKGAMFTLLGGLSLERSPGVIAFRDAVLAITAALDASSESGKELRAVIVESANAIGTELFGGVDAASISNGIRDVIPVIRGVVAVTRGAIYVGRIFFAGAVEGGRAVVGVFKLLGMAIDGQIAGVEALGSAFDDVLTLPDRLLTWGSAAAGAIVDGFVGELDARAESVTGAVQSTFENAVTSAREVLDWHSPSGVFKEAGRSVAEGFELGVRGGTAQAGAAVAQLVSPPSAGATLTAAPAGGTGPTIHIHIDGRGRSDNELVDMLIARLTDYFEGVALQGATDATT